MKLESQIYELTEPKCLILKKEIIDTESILPNDIIAKTIYTAVSPGTEVAAYSGMEPLRDNIAAYPRVVGYCNIAQVLHKGSAVTSLNVGDYFLNFQSHRSHFKCPESDFHIKLTGKDLKKTCVAYLYHLGYHGSLTADVRAGHNVGIIGAGVLGFTAAIMSKIAGANTFVMSNQSAHRDPLVAEGIALYPKDAASIPTINEASHGIGADIIINTSNTWEDWLLAMQCINRGGTIVNLGFPGRGEPMPAFNPLDPKYLYAKSVTIKYLAALNQKGLEIHEQRFNIERNLLYIIDLIDKELIDADKVISTEIPYTDLNWQYRNYASRSQSLFSTIVKWQYEN